MSPTALSAFVAALCLGTVCHASAAGPAVAPLEPLAALDVQRYLGDWYQVALFPNMFQSQCVSDTTATYRERSDGAIEVVNRCRNATGEFEQAVGVARPTGVFDGASLRPAQLEVTFVPAWLRWAQAVGNWGWGAYWVIQLAPDYRYAVVGEGSREYLWVLSRKPALSTDDEAAIRARLELQGYDLSRLKMHPQGQARPAQ
jgi:apolipoprotein D and lipocalin family protein